jgi:hypothetical protein
MGKRAFPWFVALVLMTGCTQASTTTPSGIDGLISDEDDLRAVAQCLSDRGWEAELIDGAIGVDVPADQAEAYERDSLECWSEAGVDTSGTLSEADYQAIYDWYSTIAECLRGAGWGTPERPSYEVFRSTYDSSPWIPWSEVPPTDIGRASDACPVMDVTNG